MKKDINIKKSIALIIVLVLSAIVFILQVSAYSLNVDGYYRTSIPLNTNVSSTFRNPIETACDDWNNASIPCDIAYSTAPLRNRCVIYNVNDTWYGAYAVYAQDNTDPNHITSQFELWINQYRTGTTYNIIQSVACHELGHAFGLTDLSSGTAIMNNNRNRSTVYTAKTDDINGVNASW
jgi:predicted Zn-dependent protease